MQEKPRVYSTLFWQDEKTKITDITYDTAKVAEVSGHMQTSTKIAGLGIKNPAIFFNNLSKYLYGGQFGENLSPRVFTALNQIIVDGKISNQESFNVFVDSMAGYLDSTALKMGLPTTVELHSLMQGGIDQIEFLNNFKDSVQEITKDNLIRINKQQQEVDGILIDMTAEDNTKYASELPERRVESGQTYNDYIHNLPEELSLNCWIENGKTWTPEELEEKLTRIRFSKVPFKLQLGNRTFENCAFQDIVFNRSHDIGDSLNFSCNIRVMKQGVVEYIKVKVPVKINKKGAKTKEQANMLSKKVDNGVQKTGSPVKPMLEQLAKFMVELQTKK